MSDITANVVVSMPNQLFTMARSFVIITNTGTSGFNIVNSANLKLAGAANAALSVGSSLTLRVSNGGVATEVSRAII